MIYPLLVRKYDQSGVEGPKFELIAGERRWRALKLLGEAEAPVVIRDVGDRDALELALIENVQREELNPIEQAGAYQRLVGQFGRTQEEVAQAVGKDRATVANILRLLKLPAQVQKWVGEGALSLGHARALLSLGSERSQIMVGGRVVKSGLSVRQVERVVREMIGATEREKRSKARDPHVGAAEQRMQRSLGTQVKILYGNGRGWIRIAYFSLKDLDRLIARLT